MSLRDGSWRRAIDDNFRRAVIYGGVTASFCCEGFGLTKTTKTKRVHFDRA